MSSSRVLRSLRILRVLLRHRLHLLLPPGLRAPLWLRPLLASLRLLPAPKEPPGHRLRSALEELGPIFIKFGQLLSTRRDLLPEEIADELQKLQDKVPPFPTAEARQIIEQALGDRIEAVFSQFADQPLASASVAQVYEARLADGEEVIVKVIRPGIEKVIRQDLELMYILAHQVERLWRDGRRLRPVDVVRDYERTILNELDLQLEAANTNRLRTNWEGSDYLYVPRIHWDLSRRNVLTMERIHGIRVADMQALIDNHTDLTLMAKRGVEIFFTQVFEHNYFHADMHPGNVFISREHPEAPKYIAIDCAIMGSLTEEDKTYLARNLMAFFNRDYHEVARLHIESGWVPAATNQHEFEAVIRSVCEPVFQKPIKEISFGRFLVDLFQTARQFDMEVQPQLVLLQKTLLNVEGLGRQIYPDLDLWETAKPFLEKWIRERTGPRAMLKKLASGAPLWLDQLPEIPDMAYKAMRQLGRLDDYNRNQLAIMNDLRDEIARERRRARMGRIGALTLLSALLLAWIPAASADISSPAAMGSWILGGIGVYWMFFKP